MDDRKAEIFTNRAPLCATCKYYSRETVESTEIRSTWVRRRFWFGWRESDSKPVEVKTEVRRCTVSRDCVTGRLLRHLTCEDERRRIDGCGPEGRNWVAEPRWLADMKRRHLDVHPELMVMMEDQK